jgi:hypothetical protein
VKDVGEREVYEYDYFIMNIMTNNTHEAMTKIGSYLGLVKSTQRFEKVPQITSHTVQVLQQKKIMITVISLWSTPKFQRYSLCHIMGDEVSGQSRDQGNNDIQGYCCNNVMKGTTDTHE